jgi:hypothetical protein
MDQIHLSPLVDQIQLALGHISNSDHLDCHRGHFLVVFLGIGDNAVKHMTIWVYSSEAGTWSEPTSVVQFPKYYIRNVGDMPPPAIVGSTLYFVIDVNRRILNYDLATREINVLLQPPGSDRSSSTIMTLEDGGLGVARIEGPNLFLWSMEEKPDGVMGWAQIRIIDLPKLLFVDAHWICPDFVGFAHGAGVIFVGTGYGLFSYDLKSGQVRKVCEGECHIDGIRGVVPFMSFHTPGTALLEL